MENGTGGDFQKLIEQYYSVVFYYALKKCRNGWDAGDVTQNTFVKALMHRDDLRDPDAFGPWLFRICDNERKLLYRRRDRYRAATAEKAPAPSAPPPRLRAAVESLPEHQRTPVLLKYYAGFSMAEIALLTGVPEKRVKSRLYEARKKLKERLEASVFPWNHPERRSLLMEKLNRIVLGCKVLPFLSHWGQGLLLEDARENRPFSQEVLAELSHTAFGQEFAVACDGRLSYDEFLQILASCDEPTIYRLSENEYRTWGHRDLSPLLRDLADRTGWGGYVESVETILVVPSIKETVAWYREHLGWYGEGTQEDENYGYSCIHAYTPTGWDNLRKTFKGFHLWKGETPTRGQSFLFVQGAQELRRRIRESGWEQVGDFSDRGWGTVGFTCTDLNGYRLEFCEWKAE